MSNILNTLFGTTFIGNNVFITTNVNQTHRIMLPDGTSTETLPLYFEGVLMDMDDDYYYLGDGKEVKNAVKKQYVLEVQLKTEEDQFTKYLKHIELDDGSELN